MKLLLETPTWYSRESMYVSQVKSTDFNFQSQCLDFSKKDVDFTPSQNDINSSFSQLASILSEQTSTWFATPLTPQQVEKRLICEFPKFDYQTTDKWVQAKWIPHYFQVKKSGFVLVFKIQSLSACNPRIPLTFFESMTPRATTPTEPEEEKEEVRNIVLLPGAGPTDIQQIDDIPLAETQASFELRDERTRERQRLREAKLRAAIARLRVEEMRERYLRHYGDEYFGESSESEEENSSIQSELSEPVHKK